MGIKSREVGRRWAGRVVAAGLSSGILLLGPTPFIGAAGPPQQAAPAKPLQLR